MGIYSEEKRSCDKKSSEYGSGREEKTRQAEQKMLGLFEGGLRGETAESASVMAEDSSGQKHNLYKFN